MNCDMTQKDRTKAKEVGQCPQHSVGFPSPSALVIKMRMSGRQVNEKRLLESHKRTRRQLDESSKIVGIYRNLGYREE